MIIEGAMPPADQQFVPEYPANKSVGLLNEMNELKHGHHDLPTHIKMCLRKNESREEEIR